jgi:hypothetical protein
VSDDSAATLDDVRDVRTALAYIFILPDPDDPAGILIGSGMPGLKKEIFASVLRQMADHWAEDHTATVPQRP